MTGVCVCCVHEDNQVHKEDSKMLLATKGQQQSRHTVRMQMSLPPPTTEHMATTHKHYKMPQIKATDIQQLHTRLSCI